MLIRQLGTGHKCKLEYKKEPMAYRMSQEEVGLPLLGTAKSASLVHYLDHNTPSKGMKTAHQRPQVGPPFSAAL